MTYTSEVTLVGNLTRDPELRFTQSGLAWCTFGLAVNYRKKKGDDWEDDPSFFNVTVWRDQADNVAESLSKGDRVIVTGRLKQRSWETDEGDKRSVVEIAADEVAVSLKWSIVTGTQKTSGRGKAAKPDDAPEEPFPDYNDAEEPF